MDLNLNGELSWGFVSDVLGKASLGELFAANSKLYSLVYLTLNFSKTLCLFVAARIIWDLPSDDVFLGASDFEAEANDDAGLLGPTRKSLY
jgi:hypothetical protein